MKRRTLVLMAIVLLSLSACKVVAPASTPAPTRVAPPPSGANWDDRTAYHEGLIAGERATADHMPGATVYHIDLEIPRDFDLLRGHQVLRYTNQEDESLDEIYFRLFPNITGGSATVSAVEVDGQKVEPTYELHDSAVRLVLPESLPPGDRTDIEMDFEVEVARFGSRQLESRIELLRAAPRSGTGLNAKTWQGVSSSLFADLLDPAADEIGRARRVLIMPDRNLHLLPFGALTPSADSSALRCSNGNTLAGASPPQ